MEGFQIAPAFFPMLGIEPALGRGFTNEDAQPGRDAVVLLSNGFWRRQFAADPAIVGNSIDVDGIPCTVVGVLPSTFRIFRVLNQIMWCEFRHSNLRGVLLHDMPDYFFCYSLAPNGASSANTPEQSAVRDTSFC